MDPQIAYSYLLGAEEALLALAGRMDQGYQFDSAAIESKALGYRSRAGPPGGPYLERTG